MDDGFFAQNTLVEINVPEDSELDIERALSAPEPESEENIDSLVPSIPQRTSLYFDETLAVYVVIRVPREDEEALKSRVPRLSVTVEAQAMNDPQATITSPGKDDAPQQDTIWTGTLDPTEEPTVVMEESAEEDDISTALLIWKMTAVLHRPRLRLTAPTIYWKAIAFLGPPARAKPPQDSKYLQSGVPLPTNLLSSLDAGLASDEKAPYLSAARLTRQGRPESAVPATRPIALKALPKPAFPALPALTSRIRFHKSHRRGELPTMAASLELDVPSSAPAEVDLLSVEVDLARGRVEAMAPEHAIKLPRTCRPRDSLIWLYIFTPVHAFDDPVANALSAHLLQVSIVARAHVSDTCKPTTSIRWRTSVDFNNALDTISRKLDPVVIRPPPPLPARTPQQGRPGSASAMLSPPPSAASVSGAGGGRPSSELQQQQQQHGPDNPEFTVTFVPPAGAPTVRVGEPFSWEVIVVNRTARPAQVALTAIQQRRRGGGPDRGPAGSQQQPRHSHKSSTGSITAVSKSGAVADAVVDDNLLHATVRAAAADAAAAQLVCLSADVKVGPLAPGAAGRTSLEFLPLVAGLLAPEAVRLTDMATGEHVDLRQLPDILAVDRDAGGKEWAHSRNGQDGDEKGQDKEDGDSDDDKGKEGGDSDNDKGKEDGDKDRSRGENDAHKEPDGGAGGKKGRKRGGRKKAKPVERSLA